MNERIKELAEQAGYHPDVFELCKPGMEKFAELIIRECGLFCGHDYEGVLAMFKYFGVEE
jgi:hypothetical protein